MSVLSEKEKHMYIGMITTPMSPERLVEEVEEVVIDAVVRMIEQTPDSIFKMNVDAHNIKQHLINKLKE